jgi:small-conductance mechanosensitive channel
MNSLLLEPLQRFIKNITGFLPYLLISIILIILGFLVAWLLRKIVIRVAQLLSIDRLSEKLGLSQVLEKSRIGQTLSGLIGSAVYWVVLLTFIIMGLDSLKIPAVAELMTEFWLYLPNIIIACVIVIAGYLLGNFLGRAALIAAVNAGFAVSGLVSKFVKFTVFIMAATMALELLGIGKDTVLVAFAIIFGGVVLALSIAFGLGGRDAAKEYMEKILKERTDEDDIHHI